MAKLTEEQKRFLAEQGVPLSRVFDATGLAKSQYRRLMKALGMQVAYGVAPCGRAGHRLRTSSGHCVQCGPHNLAFLRRYSEPGEVYVAHSRSNFLTKVGTALNSESRVRRLNELGYGGVYDWELRASRYCANAGRVEYQVHQTMSDCRVSRTYIREGLLVDCQELFDCEWVEAEDAIDLVLEGLD